MNNSIRQKHDKDFEDENGKVQPRLVDIESDMAQLYINHLIYIRERDYEAPKKYVVNPEHYDVKKLLKILPKSRQSIFFLYEW